MAASSTEEILSDGGKNKSDDQDSGQSKSNVNKSKEKNNTVPHEGVCQEKGAVDVKQANVDKAAIVEPETDHNSGETLNEEEVLYFKDCPMVSSFLLLYKNSYVSVDITKPQPHIFTYLPRNKCLLQQIYRLL